MRVAGDEAVKGGVAGKLCALEGGDGLGDGVDGDAFVAEDL